MRHFSKYVFVFCFVVLMPVWVVCIVYADSSNAVALVVDHSGSINQSDPSHEIATAVYEAVRSTQVMSLSMVLFNHEIRTVSAEDIPEALNSLENFGLTDLSGAMEKARQILGEIGARNSYMIVVTDGGIELGDSQDNAVSVSEAMDLLQNCADEGIRIIPIQLFSPEADQTFLRKIADITGGYFLTSNDDLKSILPRILHDLSIDITLTVEDGPYYAQDKPVGFKVALSGLPVSSSISQIISRNIEDDTSRYVADIKNLGIENKILIEYAYPGEYTALVRLQTEYGEIIRDNGVVFTVLKPLREQDQTPAPTQTPIPAQSSTETPIHMNLEDRVTYIPYLNVQWRNHVIIPWKFFNNDNTEGIQYFIKTGSIDLKAVIKEGGERTLLQPYALTEVSHDAEIIYGAIPKESKLTELEVISRGPNRKESTYYMKIIGEPAYWEFFTLITAILLLAATVVIIIVKRRRVSAEAAITFGKTRMTYVINRKMTLWEALNNAGNNLINEMEDFDAYETVMAALALLPMAETFLSGILLKPWKGSGIVIQGQGGSNTMIQKLGDGYVFRDGDTTFAELKILSGGLKVYARV